MPKNHIGVDGYYRKSIVIGRTESGGQRRKTVKAKTVRELDRKLADLKMKYDRGINFDASKMTVERWARKWLEVYRLSSGNTKNNTTYEANTRLHILPAIGHFPMEEIKPYHLQNILNGQEGRSQSHVQKVKLAIHQIFKTAYINGVIISNPAEHLQMPTGKKSDARRSITDKEREQILRLAETHHAGLWVKLMLYCGLRPAETAALLWSNIDFAASRIHVRRALEAGRNDIKTTKTKAGDRVIPIPAVLLDDLRNAERRGEYVFTQKTNCRPHTQTTLRKLWLSFKRGLDIQMGASVTRNRIVESVVAGDLVPYCLRHTFCTDLQDAGVPINVAKYLMGHTDISVTSKIYTHQTDNMTAEVAAKMDLFHTRGYFQVEKMPVVC
jgi:integrase